MHPGRVVMRRCIRGINPRGAAKTLERRIRLFKAKLREALGISCLGEIR